MNTNTGNDAVYPQGGIDPDLASSSLSKELASQASNNQSPVHDYVPQAGPAGHTDHSAQDQAAYMDWTSQFLLDGANTDLLANFDFSTTMLPTNHNNNNNNNNIMQKIQFQNSVHDQPMKSHDLQQTYGDSPHLSHPIQSPPSPPMASMASMPSVASMASMASMPSMPSMAHQVSGLPQSNMPGHSAQNVHSKSPAQNMPATSVPAKDARAKPRRPCDHCRRKKIRCVIIPGTENCAQCEAKSLTCTYTRLPPSKEEPSAKRARNGQSSDYADPGSQAHSQNMYDIVPPNVPIRTVAPVQDYSTMNNSLLKKTLSLQFPRSSFYVGPTSYLFDTNLLEVIIGSQNKPQGGLGANSGRPATLNKIEQVNLSDKISLRKVENKTQFVLQDDQTRHSIQTMSNDVDAIEKFIAPHGQILIDLYFRIIHPSYPILHKKVFLEKYSRTHREFSAPLLAAVYVLAIQWWDYDPQLNRFPKPNVELILRIALNNYILEILKRPKLSAVQAGLLLLQCKHILRGINVSHAPPGAYGSASASLTSAFNDSDYNDWVLCSQVVALAEELGLGLDCDSWKLPKWERGLRKRLAWAVYLEDKWLALKNSRPSHINDINWVVSDLAEEDFPEKHGDGDLKEGSSDINNGKKNFMNLICLSKIISEILNALFSMRAMKDITEINEVLRVAKPIQLKLREWYHSLPIELQMNSVQPRKLCSNGYLQLAYFAAELTLHRKIITTIYQQNMHGTKIPEELVSVCRSAARTRLIASIDFVKDLKPEHIHSFWHSSASSNFTLIGTFAALLFISSLSKEEAKDFKEKVYDYRWVLKISAKGFVQIGDSLHKLDLVMNQIPGLLNDSTEQPSMVPNVSTIDYNKPQAQQQQQQQQQSMSKYQQLPKNSPLSQHSPRSPVPQSHSNSPQQLHYQKPVSHQQPYPKSSPATEPRPSVQRHSSSGQGVSPYTNNAFGSANSNGNSQPAPGNQRHPSQTPHLPFDSAQAFQGQMYQQQQHSGMNSIRGTPISTHSPSSTSGRSPREPVRQQRASSGKITHAENTPSHDSPGQGVTSQSGAGSESTRNSPVLVRSPLAQQHNAKADSAAGEAGKQSS